MKKYFLLDDMESMKKKNFKENVKKITVLFSLLLFFYKINEESKKKKVNCFAPKCMLFDSQLCICVSLSSHIVTHVVYISIPTFFPNWTV